MSKYTKLADIARQSGQSQADRPEDYCAGCGYYRATRGKHRDDCTKPSTDTPQDGAGK